MANPEEKNRVSLEDLLRLKRTERPSAEFWNRFEHELRQKQLTALVHKRRWWHGLPLLLSRRVFVPAGAAAVITFTLVSVRLSNHSVAAKADVPVSSSIVAAPSIENLPVTEVVLTSSAPAALSADNHGRAEIERIANLSGSPDVTASVELQPLPLAPNERDRPSAKSIAATLARLEQAEPELVNAVMGGRLSTPARVQSASSESTEDSGVSGNRYRLIARYAEHSLTPEPAAPAPVRERLARRLGDDITERISRIGVEGSRVSLKF